MRIRSLAAARIASFLVQYGAKSALARELGVRQQTFWNWLNGYARPPLRRMIELEKLFGVPVHEWAVDAAPATKSVADGHVDRARAAAQARLRHARELVEQAERELRE